VTYYNLVTPTNAQFYNLSPFSGNLHKNSIKTRVLHFLMKFCCKLPEDGDSAHTCKS